MKIKLCSKGVLELEVRERIKNLKNKETMKINITPTNILDNTFNLEIKYLEKEKIKKLNKIIGEEE